MVTQLLGYLGDSEGNAENFGEALVSYSGQLSESSSPERVREVVGTLLAETVKMAEHHKKLQKHVSESTAEITLFKSLGLAVEDIASAHYIYQVASETGAGTYVELGGSRHAG